MNEQKLLTGNPISYGSIERALLFNVTNEQVRAAGEQKQVYIPLPFVNDLITLAVGQVKALFNQELLMPPATQTRLNQILNNPSDAHLPRLIRAFRVPELTEESTHDFVLLAEYVSLDLDYETMSDAVKRDFIFVLNCSLSVLEGVDKSKVINCIGHFERALNNIEESAEVTNASGSSRRMSF